MLAMLLLFLLAIQAAGLVVAAAFGLALPFSWVLERAALRGRRPAGGSVATVLTCAAGILLGLGVTHAASVTGQHFQATLAGNPEASPTDFTWVYLTFMTTLVALGLGLSRWQYGRVLRLHAVVGGLLVLTGVALAGVVSAVK
ncbi:hypothetical protein [Deinococcus knuensis]|uniref:Uncharacterized protein n=1 Tax=Deinococcus knuensis TaxID=1837380 RepID=A0ABQ2SFR4_9DEIO|nr:hypothetical protein [Deinococcus knuensis]GGS26517.1 hypothetical protein GCM10008961_17410 [Deinococcus knuensis]